MIAVIGAGNWGRNHIRVLHDIGALTAVHDQDTETCLKYAGKYKDVICEHSFANLFSYDEIKAVVIATPSNTHFDIARAALLKDKHVLIEKPMALNVNDAIELIKIAKLQNKILMVGHLMQYHPTFIKLKELIMAAELGDIRHISSRRLGFGRVRQHEDVLWSLAPHDISMILSITGCLPSDTTITMNKILRKDIADSATMHFDFPEFNPYRLSASPYRLSARLTADVSVSWLHPVKERKFIVIGDRAMAVFDDTKTRKLTLYCYDACWDGTYFDNNYVPVLKKTSTKIIDTPIAEPLIRECEHFIDCIRTGKTPLTDGEEGLRVLKVLS